MKSSNFEAVKVAMKQDRTGYVLTLSVHPDQVPEEILRDFVGARYQVVMVRVGDDEMPFNRNNYKDAVKLAGILCKDPHFHLYLMETGKIEAISEVESVRWLRKELNILSRAELKDNHDAAVHLFQIQEEFLAWKHLNA